MYISLLHKTGILPPAPLLFIELIFWNQVFYGELEIVKELFVMKFLFGQSSFQLYIRNDLTVSLWGWHLKEGGVKKPAGLRETGKVKEGREI